MYEALKSDADAYFTRHSGREDRPRDPVLDVIFRIHAIDPMRSVLEVGCSTGWRLDDVRKKTGAICVGLEASNAAVLKGKIENPEVHLIHGVAPWDLPRVREIYGDRTFDCVIIGFIEYLIPRAELFRFAAEVDSLLRDGGHLIIFDFLHPRSHQKLYTHNESLNAYKSDPSLPWTWSPTYSLLNRELFLASNTRDELNNPDMWMCVDLLRKFSEDHAYPRESTSPIDS